MRKQPPSTAERSAGCARNRFTALLPRALFGLAFALFVLTVVTVSTGVPEPRRLTAGPLSEAATCTALAAALVALSSSAVRRRRQRALDQADTSAATAQQVLLRPLPGRIGDLRLRGTYVPARTAPRSGGDLYDAVHSPYGTRLLIGDVRAKGMLAVEASALLLRSFREAAYEEEQLTEVARRLEHDAQRHIARLPGAETPERFATALLVEIPDGPVARVVHCGHPAPLLVSGGRVSPCPPERPGAPVGMADLVGAGHAVQTLPFRAGERLVLLTDGFTEARDAAGRFHPFTERAAAPLDDLVDGLRADLVRHAGGELRDDAALLVVERVPG
ncbi:membrane protein [Streptomyces chrestomyceticus JCM 4735]|uniref:Membrane protein n=1 Tax=Streptomyces chrestomyceticus JCM 4735 TaxID=1306181 RepID=A0A7U9L423_9ACTN|nr:PP2C family protein-serine/threonine phosphatase [Streptomyces chrestomyceticus]GCD39201.1 membrane protein [Streptomyces chrestomyceticus JCM 4735]